MLEIKKSFKLFGEPNTVTMVLWYTLLVLGVFSVWQFQNLQGIPKPVDVLKAFNVLLRMSGGDSLLWNIYISLKLIIISTLYASVISLIFSYLGVFKALVPLNRFIQVLRYIPVIGFTLVFYHMFPIGFVMKEAMMVAGLTFFFVTSMTATVNSVTKMQFELGKSLGLKERSIFKRVFFDPTVPSIIDTIRTNAPMTWLMLVAVENFNRTEGGMGAKIGIYNSSNQLDKVFAYLFIIAIFALLFELIAYGTKRLFFPWTLIQERG